MPRELQLLQCNCPHCAAELSGATSVNGPNAPAPGAMSLCSYCGEWCVFNDDLNLAIPTQAQIDYISVCPVARAMERTWKEHENDHLLPQEMERRVIENGEAQVPDRPPLAIHRTLH